MYHVKLGELVTILEGLVDTTHDDLNHFSFHYPHSYRGYYDRLAFEPSSGESWESMLSDAKDALGRTYQGWKGGDFTMTENTLCYIAMEGSTGEQLFWHDEYGFLTAKERFW